MPLISIITPTYKWAWYIAETIRSVSDQNFSDYEHIIINDNSPDNVEKIILSFQKTDPRIRYIKNKKNIWIAASRNIWISQSIGRYLCFLDHDDIFIDPNKLVKQLNFLQNNSEYVIVSSLIITIDSTWKHLHKNHAWESDKDIRDHLLQSNQFLPCAMMVCKDSVIQAWCFDPMFDKADDYDLWMKIGKKWKMYCIQEYMTGYRVHKNNTSSSLMTTYHMRWLAWRIFWKNRVCYPHFWSAFFMRSIEWLIPPKIVSKIIHIIKKIK